MKKRLLFIAGEGLLVRGESEGKGTVWQDGVFHALRRISDESDFCLVLGSDPASRAADEMIIDTMKGEKILFDEVLELETPKKWNWDESVYDKSNSFIVTRNRGGLEKNLDFGCQTLVFDDFSGWEAIAGFLLGDRLVKAERTASISRKTAETDISLDLNLDGRGDGRMETGIGFLDHMLAQVVRHGSLDVNLKCKGDLEVDEHHSVEDIAIVFGQAVAKALGDKRGIARYGSETLVMDEVLALCALDFSGRPYLVIKGKYSRDMVGTFPTELFEHFFHSFAYSAGCTLHIEFSEGNAHHQAEAVFKAFARAMRQAVKRYPFSDQLPSTKGIL